MQIMKGGRPAKKQLNVKMSQERCSSQVGLASYGLPDEAPR